ncbi:snake venom serine protease Dav-PA-like [Gambusia affinis]|uniref:snake venom serine protease Dav-PA-like n=1 Tax=Gambusia affinis TaxID=33528 RepID=UPI001CDCF822|nr:snake venom serine protease Dav-PA-like [Gambusia affinis]
MALLKVLVLLLELDVAVSSVSLQKRVLGGQNCKDDERQYHVYLKAFNETHSNFCGGSLITDQWVLTSAHCRNSDPGWFLSACVGVHPKSTEERIFPINHLEIYKDSNGREHDIMLVKLPTKIIKIRPIKLPDCPDTLLLGTKVQIAGYGSAIVGCFNRRVLHNPDALQCAELKIDKHARLEKILAKYEFFHYTFQKWYSVESSKKDISFGDSGGGWVFRNRLYGVQAFIGEKKYAYRAPSGFMDVCAYKKWIDDTIN